MKLSFCLAMHLQLKELTKTKKDSKIKIGNGETTNVVCRNVLKKHIELGKSYRCVFFMPIYLTSKLK